MAKKVTGSVKLQIAAGKATPAPPVGPALGQALWSGLALPQRRLPRAGELDATEQYAYAPRAGLWRTARQIGDAVTAGALLGTLDEVAVRAPIAGPVRGLVHDGVAVPGGAIRIEGAGRYLIPGLADMHVHFTAPGLGRSGVDSLQKRVEVERTVHIDHDLSIHDEPLIR